MPQSYLDKDRYTDLSAEQRLTLHEVEQAAHGAASDMLHAVADQLPPELVGYALDVAAVGLFTALARIIAENRGATVARAKIDALTHLLPRELGAWQAAEADHVRH